MDKERYNEVMERIFALEERVDSLAAMCQREFLSIQNEFGVVRREMKVGFDEVGSRIDGLTWMLEENLQETKLRIVKMEENHRRWEDFVMNHGLRINRLEGGGR